MRHETAVSLIKELMDKLERGVNVDAGGIRKNAVSSYTCSDLAAREWDGFFRNHPQVICVVKILILSDIYVYVLNSPAL